MQSRCIDRIAFLSLLGRRVYNWKGRYTIIAQIMLLPMFHILFIAVILHCFGVHKAAGLPEEEHSSLSVFQNYFARFLPSKHIGQSNAWSPRRPMFEARTPSHIEEVSRPKLHSKRKLIRNLGTQVSSSISRHTLAKEDSEADEDIIVSGMSVSEMKTKIAEHKMKLSRLKQQAKDLAHERAFLEKTLEFKRGQRKMQDGQVKLSQAELEDKAKEIEMYKREAPRTLAKYNELVRKQKELQETLNRLHQETEELSTSRNVILDKIQHLNMEDLIERHARGLPDAMAGALRKSAAVLVPFFDYLIIAADTNNRLVDHVGEEIDKYTHVNISASPFMSGVLFYCVLLVPVLTVVSFVRRIFDTSSRLTVSHYIIFGNLYFIIICLANVIAALVLRDDPVNVMFRKFEKTFVIGNLFLSIYYAWHVIMLGLQAIYTLERRNISQFVATLTVGIHYFLFAWRRIFTDNAPLMYTFNYLVYGTIFCFILYERYNRMSTKQLNDSAIFRLLQLVLKRRHQLASARGIKHIMAEVWTAITKDSNKVDRKYSKKEDRCLTSERSKLRAEEKKRSRAKGRDIYTSEEEDSDNYHEKGLALSRKTRAKEKRRKQSKRPGKSKGFISMFFGSQENAAKSSEDDSEEYKSSWRLLRGSGRNDDTESSRMDGISSRNSHTGRPNRNRDRKVVKHAPTSLWGWS